MPSFLRPLGSVLAASALLCASCYAFQTPLSEESVREAYFLGQRHDESLARFLEKYTQALPVPKTGPYISSMTFLTPFALVAQRSDQHSTGYSAQQAALDHRGTQETVQVVVHIQLTETYGALIPRKTGPRSDSPIGYAFRPSDFWRDFDVQVFPSDRDDDEPPLMPVTSSGEPTYVCVEEGGCVLSGATLYFEFPAEAFPSDSAVVQVNPPEGDQVVVDFNLSALR